MARLRPARAATPAHRGEASWLLGIGWGLWHIPSVLVGPYLLGQVHLGLVLPILLGLTVGIVGWTIVITWIYNHTHSVFWIIVLHGWYNTVQSYLILSSEQFAAQAVFPLLPWAVAIVLLRRYGSRTLTGPAPTPTTQEQRS